MKKAFTLAEIMIVLVIIGVITAILLPIAIHNAPDENVMKFKKGNNTLGTVIRELVNSDEYYANGDLSIRADGVILDDSTDDNKKYLCETFANIISVKNVDCSTYKNYSYSHIAADWNNEDMGENGILDAKKTPDEICKKAAEFVGEEIIMTDGIVYYEASPGTPFGIQYVYNDPFSDVKYENGEMTCGVKGLFKIRNTAKNCDEYFIKPIGTYKTFCMDIDGINKGEDPFGYGIRVDGKILYGARAQEWMQKSIQKGD